MSITIADCLKMTSLREAKILAGSGGLNKIVTAVSVLESADNSIITGDLFFGNEIIITAFISIKDDIKAQCDVIQRLSESGEVAIILYYVGIFLPEVDNQLLDLANKLNLPLICMPTDRFDYRYSEVISEVYEAIFQDKKKETYFVTNMINRIAQLREWHHTIDTVLRIISDHLRCTFLLCNRMYEQKSAASWPMSSRWDYQEVLDISKDSVLLAGQRLPIELSGKQAYLLILPITVGNSHMRLIAIDETGTLSQSNLEQAGEVIQLSANIWQREFKSESVNTLVHSILRDEPINMRQIAASMKIDLRSINVMWVLKETQKHLTIEDIQSRNLQRVNKLEMFLDDRNKLAFVDVFENNVVAFMGSPTFNELEKGISDDFIESISKSDTSFTLIIISNLKTTTEIHASYVLIENIFETAKLIYPFNRTLYSYELKFAKNCLDLIEKGEEMLASIIKELNPLKTQEDGDDLIQTLSVFLLDSQSNILETGKRMFLHKNTVKYRINKIKQRLGCDINKMPENYGFYLAVALNRILNANDTNNIGNSC